LGYYENQPYRSWEYNPCPYKKKNTLQKAMVDVGILPGMGLPGKHGIQPIETVVQWNELGTLAILIQELRINHQLWRYPIDNHI